MKYALVPENAISYQFTLKVKLEDIDMLNHVNNVVYLKWINEASERHWAILTNKDIDSKYFWVCIRHEIDYIGEAYLNDEINICTWIGQSSGVKSIRHVAIYKSSKLICKAKTTWCLIDAKTKKPAPIREDILNLLS